MVRPVCVRAYFLPNPLYEEGCPNGAGCVGLPPRRPARAFRPAEHASRFRPALARTITQALQLPEKLPYSIVLTPRSGLRAPNPPRWAAQAPEPPPRLLPHRIDAVRPP